MFRTQTSLGTFTTVGTKIVTTPNFAGFLRGTPNALLPNMLNELAAIDAGWDLDIGNISTQKTEVGALQDTLPAGPSPSARAWASFGTIGFEVYLAAVAEQFNLRLTPPSDKWAL